jgi:hypothetical protein
MRSHAFIRASKAAAGGARSGLSRLAPLRGVPCATRLWAARVLARFKH